jgi:hypothetical protein
VTELPLDPETRAEASLRAFSAPSGAFSIDPRPGVFTLGVAMTEEFARTMLPPSIGGLLALLFLFLAMRAGKRKRLVDNLPTSKTTGIFIGLVEVKGTAESEGPFTSALAEQRCVHYQWSIEEHWSRTVTETYTDSKGQSRTRTRHESGWKTVDSGGESAPFYLQDDHGVVLVRPEGAEIEPAVIFSETCGSLDPLYYGKGPAFAVADSDHRRRFTESAIALHAPLYVIGRARERSDIVAPEIAKDGNAPMFLISTRGEERVSSGLGWAVRGWGIAGLVLAVAGLAVPQFLGGSRPPEPDWSPAILAGAAYLLACAVGWVWMVFNSMVDLHQRVRQAWSLVDVQLKRRHDLIPNLVAAVTGLRDHERKLQTEVASLRAQLAATPPGVEGPDYQAVGKVLMAVAERYPELRSQEAFSSLQKNLSDTETRIALARGYFNEIATHYNTRLQIVPDRFVAALAGMQPQSLMAAGDFERAPVAVHLAE